MSEYAAARFSAVADHQMSSLSALRDLEPGDISRVGPVNRFYALLLDNLDPQHLPGLAASTRWNAELRALAANPVVRGFEMVKKTAKRHACLEVFATAHTSAEVASARVLLGEVDIRGSTATGWNLRVYPGLCGVSLGWDSAADMDLLRLVALGERVLGPACYGEISRQYIERHSARFARLFRAADGALAIVRIPRITEADLFSTVDTHRFAAAQGIPVEAIPIASQDPPTNNPEITELCLTALLTGAREELERGGDLAVRVLPTITFPAEARSFVELLNRLTPRILGERAVKVIHGVTVCPEPTGSYLRLKNMLAPRGRWRGIDGIFVSSADLTSASLNSTANPGSLRSGLLPQGVFRRYAAEIVASAISDSLGHVASGHFWGIGGELMGNWQNVSWLASRACELGLRYVTTSADTLFPALFAAAKASVARIEPQHPDVAHAMGTPCG